MDLFLSDALLSKLIGGFSLSLPHHFLQCFRNLDISPSLHLSFSDVCQAVTVTKGRGAVPSRLPCEIEEDHIIRTFMSGLFFLLSLVNPHTQKTTKANPMQKYFFRDFPGGPVVDSMLPMQEAQVPSLIKELDPTGHN